MKLNEKILARKLRKENGQSIDVIAKTLNVAKSSVSLWVRDIPLTIEQIETLKKNTANGRFVAGYSVGAQKNRDNAQKRHLIQQTAGYKKASQNENFRLICAIYWGEGAKTQTSFSISNSDYALLKLIVDWLTLEGYKDKIRLRVSYHPGNGFSENDIKQYWCDKLSLTIENCNKFSILDINKSKKIGKTPYGTAVVSVHSSELKQMTMGGINYLKQLIVPKI